MEKKFLYEAPEMESIILIKEAVMLNDSFNNKSNDGYDSDNNLDTIG